MRGQGRVYSKPGSRFLWIDYSLHGKRHQESTRTTKHREAHRLLRQRIGDREAGKLVGAPDRVRFAERNDAGELTGGLRQLVERQYVLDARRSLTRVQLALQHVEDFFGAARAMEITVTRLNEYAEARLAASGPFTGRRKAARATVNQELAAVRRGFRLAIEHGLLAVMPVVKLPKVHNERQGFFSDGDMAALLLELPAYLRPVLQFARLTGWSTGRR